MKKAEFKAIAEIKTDFQSKFGLPRQAFLASEIKGRIVFEKEYRNPDAIRGLEGFSHIWLLWMFSESVTEKFMPTVRPPRLGGNKRIGVFATRSPFRPNPIGLSCVKIEKIILSSPEGPIIEVSGCDMINDTPIFDIKPYLPYTDSIPEASNGFAEEGLLHTLSVVCPEEEIKKLDCEKREILKKILSCDPRPSYQEEPERIYGFDYAGFEIKFKVEENILTVLKIQKSGEKL